MCSLTCCDLQLSYVSTSLFGMETGKRFYCGHCDEKISKTLYYQHKRIYYNSKTHKWNRDIHNTRFPRTDVLTVTTESISFGADGLGSSHQLDTLLIVTFNLIMVRLLSAMHLAIYCIH